MSTGPCKGSEKLGLPNCTEERLDEPGNRLQPTHVLTAHWGAPVEVQKLQCTCDVQESEMPASEATERLAFFSTESIVCQCLDLSLSQRTGLSRR